MGSMRFRGSSLPLPRCLQPLKLLLFCVVCVCLVEGAMISLQNRKIGDRAPEDVSGMNEYSHSQYRQINVQSAETHKPIPKVHEKQNLGKKALPEVTSSHCIKAEVTLEI